MDCGTRSIRASGTESHHSVKRLTSNCTSLAAYTGYMNKRTETANTQADSTNGAQDQHPALELEKCRQFGSEAAELRQANGSPFAAAIVSVNTSISST
jgi:hypothetical protein